MTSWNGVLWSHGFNSHLYLKSYARFFSCSFGRVLYLKCQRWTDLKFGLRKIMEIPQMSLQDDSMHQIIKRLVGKTNRQ